MNSSEPNVSKSRWQADRTFGFTMAILLGLLQGLWWADIYPRFGVLVWLTERAGGATAVAWGMWLAAVVLAVTALICPMVLWPLNKAWTALGLGLGAVMSRVVLAVIYYLVVTPVGRLRVWFSTDPMQRRFEADRQSYWQLRPKEPFDPQRCTKQY